MPRLYMRSYLWIKKKWCKSNEIFMSTFTTSTAWKTAFHVGSISGGGGGGVTKGMLSVKTKITKGKKNHQCFGVKCEWRTRFVPLSHVCLLTYAEQPASYAHTTPWFPHWYISKGPFVAEQRWAGSANKARQYYLVLVAVAILISPFCTCRNEIMKLNQYSKCAAVFYKGGSQFLLKLSRTDMSPLAIRCMFKGSSFGLNWKSWEAAVLY